MTDRAAVNHATVVEICEEWGKSLNELNCHLHPLETISTSCKTALKNLQGEKSQLHGHYCLAGNIVLAVNKLRYKDGKGNPKGFSAFLAKKQLPTGLLPRYRGNRLHILFHICGKLYEHHSVLLEFFECETSRGGLLEALKSDFVNETAILQMQVLRLMGKYLTGPWMKQFYGPIESKISHLDGIAVVKNVVHELKDCFDNPCSILSRSSDFFGNILDQGDATLKKLLCKQTGNRELLFAKMLKSCLSAIITVIERQYKRYFGMHISEVIKRQTMSARLHNMDAEAVIWMFSAEKQKARNASVSFLSARIRAKSNQVITYLRSMESCERMRVVSWAIRKARQKQGMDREKQRRICKQLSQKAAIKLQKKKDRDSKALEKELMHIDVADFAEKFSHLDEDTLVDLTDLHCGNAVGRNISHSWYDQETEKVVRWLGRLENLKKKGVHRFYTVAYWQLGENYEEHAEDYEIRKNALCADLINNDLQLC